MFGLRAAAGRFQQDEFQPWDVSTGKFLDCSIAGRLFRVDRFTTIYHRPTRRRQATFPPGTTLPASGLVKHVASGNIFILSETVREDANKGVIYDRIVALHLADPPSGGLGTLYRPTVTGTAGDLGPVSLVKVTDTYIDLELRTTQAEPETVDQTTALLFITLPAWVDLRENDWIQFGGLMYLVDDPYFDGGFQMARASRLKYTLQDMVYLQEASAGATYDAATGTYTPAPITELVFSAVIGIEHLTSSGVVNETSASIDAYVSTDHIDWTPKPNSFIRIGATRFKISSVVLGKDERQWHLTLVRFPEEVAGSS